MPTSSPAAALLLAALAMAPLPAARAQAAPDTTLLRRLFASPEFAAQSAGRTQWLDGDSYTAVEGGEIVRVDAATGRREVLVAADRLRPEGAARPLPVEGYTFSADRA